jgi:hypothetical protein
MDVEWIPGANGVGQKDVRQKLEGSLIDNNMLQSDWPQWSLELAEWAPVQSEGEAAAEAAAASLLRALHVTGDETLLGPDGEMYEVFYPRDCMPEEPTPTVITAPADCSPSTSDCQEQQVAQQTQCVETLLADQPASQSTGWGIGDIVTYMQCVRAARYPARARFFEFMRAVTAATLGSHFDRLALVGSAALCIDTPESDLDAVAFTQPSPEDGSPSPPPGEVLRRIAEALVSAGWPLRLQLVDCARVPVLTVITPTADGELESIDLTVDQPLGEWHVLWFLGQRAEPEPEPAPLQKVPAPRPDGWEQGLEAAALRCVKWWLRRRRLPVSKEGGFPTVTWTLMVIHVLRCSLFLKEAGSGGNCNTSGLDEQALLGALALFFDRFAGGGPAGTLHFASDGRAEFWPQQPVSEQASQTLLPEAAHLSVLDPTTSEGDGAQLGVQHADLAPRISPATRLLHAFELRRAAQLSAAALDARSQANDESNNVLRELFTDVGETANTVPVDVNVEDAHAARSAVAVLVDGVLQLGVLEKVRPKRGWNAPFLHRGDSTSRLAMRPCVVDTVTGAVSRSEGLTWFCPVDFVCALKLQQDSLTDESLERWRELNATLFGAASQAR